MARKNISGSLRWHVLARDGFTCRYCGAAAGQDGVELAVDHIVSVKDGGTNNPDNLATACRSCNGGKSSRSLQSAPTPKQVIARVKRMAGNLQQQADAIKASVEAAQALRQQIVNMKCAAYQVDRCTIASNEVAIVKKLLAEFGADIVHEFYTAAKVRNVNEAYAIRYVCGCARARREEGANA